MIARPHLLAAVALGLGVIAFAVPVLLGLVRDDGEASTGDAGPGVRVAGFEGGAGDIDPMESVGYVSCDDCGARNDPGYRYCRDCAGRL